MQRYGELNAGCEDVTDEGRSGLTNLTRHQGGDFTSPVGSPPVARSADGKKIAFLSDGEGNVEIYSINVDRTGLSRLTRTSGAELRRGCRQRAAASRFFARTALSGSSAQTARPPRSCRAFAEDRTSY